ncbi:hypothetical protein X975_10916, partial [Stegodyphus mimosarum]
MVCGIWNGKDASVVDSSGSRASHLAGCEIVEISSPVLDSSAGDQLSRSNGNHGQNNNEEHQLVHDEISRLYIF